MKIVISGSAQALDRATGEVISDSRRLSQLHGKSYSSDVCGNYLADSLYDIGVSGGMIELSYETTRPRLRVLTTYRAPRKLNEDELQTLIAETTGQWSDGIGEGGFQHADEFGMDVDISPTNSETTVEQVDDGVKVPERKKNPLVEILQHQPVDEEKAIALLEGGAAIDEKDRHGRTVLQLACRAVVPRLVELLLQRGALENSENPSLPLTTLVFCYGTNDVLENSVRIAKLLIEKGVNADAFDDRGRTPLMMAANRNNLPLVKFLLSQGANINAQDTDELNQHSVLMYAQHPEMVQYLLESGADPRICTASGKNAYEDRLRNSHQKGYKEAAEIIKRYLD